MKELKNPSFSQRYTEVLYETGKAGTNIGVPTIFRINDSKGNLIQEIRFQDGSTREGINGVFNEDLLLMIISRLEAWQKGSMPDASTEKALEKLYEATFWMRRRTDERKARGVLGTQKA